MEVGFDSGKMAKLCNSEKAMVRAFGAEGAKRVARRLAQLAAAGCLEDLRHAPGRCHELRTSEVGELSLDVHGPNRLIFRPVDVDACTREEGSLDWTAVTEIVVTEIADTHE